MFDVWYLSVQEVQKENSLEKVCYQTFWSNLDLHFSSATVGPISIESSQIGSGKVRALTAIQHVSSRMAQRILASNLLGHPEGNSRIFPLQIFRSEFLKRYALSFGRMTKIIAKQKIYALGPCSTVDRFMFLFFLWCGLCDILMYS